jgi:hypothetical protein
MENKNVAQSDCSVFLRMASLEFVEEVLGADEERIFWFLTFCHDCNEYEEYLKSEKSISCFSGLVLDMSEIFYQETDLVTDLKYLVQELKLNTIPSKQSLSQVCKLLVNSKTFQNFSHTEIKIEKFVLSNKTRKPVWLQGKETMVKVALVAVAGFFGGSKLGISSTTTIIEGDHNTFNSNPQEKKSVFNFSHEQTIIKGNHNTFNKKE